MSDYPSFCADCEIVHSKSDPCAAKRKKDPKKVLLYRIRNIDTGEYYWTNVVSATSHWRKTGKFLTKAALAQVAEEVKQASVVECWEASYVGEQSGT